VQWTPTLIVLDPEGVERHRVEGFLPVDDFLAQLELGLAKIAFQRASYADAEARFRSVCEAHAGSGAAPEACYWAGVAAYKASNDPAPLKATAQRLQKAYPGSEWTRKASVWL
jgi:outer membrane protein assembly factor BamD (BamD/ComL family)